MRVNIAIYTPKEDGDDELMQIEGHGKTPVEAVNAAIHAKATGHEVIVEITIGYVERGGHDRETK